MLVLHPNAVKSGVMSTRAVVVNAVLLAGVAAALVRGPSASAAQRPAWRESAS